MINRDDQLADSLISCIFTPGNDSLVWNFETSTGELVLSASGGYAGETNLKSLLKGFAKGSFPTNALPVTVTFVLPV